jgi:hypothetical protein
MTSLMRLLRNAIEVSDLAGKQDDRHLHPGFYMHPRATGPYRLCVGLRMGWACHKLQIVAGLLTAQTSLFQVHAAWFAFWIVGNRRSAAFEKWMRASNNS